MQGRKSCLPGFQTPKPGEQCGRPWFSPPQVPQTDLDRRSRLQLKPCSFGPEAPEEEASFFGATNAHGISHRTPRLPVLSAVEDIVRWGRHPSELSAVGGPSLNSQP
jgi:hypothetical protein